MITGDNKDKRLSILEMEVVRLNNLVASRDAYVLFLEEELKSIEKEHAEELKAKDDYIEYQSSKIDTIQKSKEEVDNNLADAKNELDETRAIILSLQGQLLEANSDKEELTKVGSDAQEIAKAAEKAKMDLKDVVNLLQNRIFNTNSDRMRYLNGAIDLNDPLVNEMGYEEIINEVLRQTNVFLSENKKEENKDRAHANTQRGSRGNKSQAGKPKPRHIFTQDILEKFGIDRSNLSDNARLIHRKDKKTGEDVWTVELLHYQKARLQKTVHEIGRFNVPGSDPMCSKHPECIIKGNPVMPSFASFYMNGKIGYNLSENRITRMLEEMGADIPQSTLNKWMHDIMALLRDRLQTCMLKVIKMSYFTQNDEVRVLVRSRKDKNSPFEYHVEYIHGCLSPEARMVVMLYDEGTRGHSVPENMIFRDSNIKCFLADRLSMYTTIVNDLEEYNLVRAACYFHGRHYFCDAVVADERARLPINLINSLFLLEGEAKDMDHAHRLAFRLKHSEIVVRKLFKLLKQMKLNEDDYGALMKRAINYMLDDEKAFKEFLTDGAIELSNNAAERMFRHIAMGRRNWLHIGSHMAAQNIAFMYSLYESCKMNNIDFGKYLEDILTRMMKGDTDYMSMIPCNYKTSTSKVEDKECA